MRLSTAKILAFPLVLALCALTGCFDEPTPAYKTVPAEARVYLPDQHLKTLPAEKFAGRETLVDYLNLDRNELTDIAAVTKLTSLKWLRLNSNRLSSLPELKSLVSLRRIYLKDNRFTEVPAALNDLPALTDIELSGNPISEIPEWLAAKPNLAFLSFNRTNIRKLPADISAWRSLKALQLGDSPISSDKAEMARVRQALPDTAIIF